MVEAEYRSTSVVPQDTAISVPVNSLLFVENMKDKK